MKDSKTVKLIIGIVAAVMAVAGAVAVVIIFKDQIKDILIAVKEWIYTTTNQAKDLCKKTFKRADYTSEECEVFADLEEETESV